LRVQFSPCGLGLGHTGRCIPLARRLVERGARVLFSTYREGARHVRREGFPVVEVPSTEYCVEPDGTFDFRQTAVNPGPFLAPLVVLRQVQAEVRVMQAFRPDVVVSDTRVTPLLAAWLMGIPQVTVLNQFQIIIPRRTMFLRIGKLVDAGALALVGTVWTAGARVIIPDFPPPHTLSEGNLRLPERYRRHITLVGPILPTRPEELPSRAEIRRDLGLGDERLIFAPLSGPPEERTYFAGMLRRIFRGFPRDYRVVMSLGHPENPSRPVREGNLTVYPWVANRFEYLKACDLVVARAGHGTLTQAICYGKPLVLVPTPNHSEQINNARRAAELGIAEVTEQGRLTRQRLLAAVEKMLSPDYGEMVRRVQGDVLELNGVEAAVRVITEAAEQGD